MKRVFNILVITAWVFLLGSCKPDPVRVSKVTLNATSLTMIIDDVETLTATISPYNADNQKIIWSTTNASVAKVSEGKVTAVGSGHATITAQADDGGVPGTCEVYVNVPFVHVTGVTLDQSSVTMKETEWLQLHATVSPSNADDPTLTWSSSDPEVVQVTSDGYLLARKFGTAVITVTTVDGSMTATCSVTVENMVTGLVLVPSSMDILVGDEADIEARLEPEDANVTVSWASVDPEIVSVDDKGHIKALAAGDAVICAATAYKGLQSYCKIHVRNKVESVTITAPAGEKEINIGETLQLKAVVAPADLQDVKIEWTSSDSGVAMVSSNGLVTAKSKGNATITVTVKNGSEEKTATYEIEVVQPVTSISVSPKTLTMYVGDELEIDEVFTIEVGPENANDRSVRYGYSRADIINVEKGKLTGLKAGDVVLYFYPKKPNSTELKDECQIKVKAKVKGITIEGGDTRTIQVKETVQLKATVNPANADQGVEWSSSKPEIATVSEKGLVTGVTAGTTEITVTSKDDPSITATCTVTVENIPVKSVTLNKSTLTLVEGNTETLIATVTPDDAFEKTITWTSSNTSVATVSDKGVVTAVKAGTATITAACGGQSATCTVTVQPKSVSVSSVTLNQTAVTLELGDSYQLIATVLPENASNKEVTWSSSNTSVAKVDISGRVISSAIGTSVITVTTVDGNKTATCTVTVTAPSIPVSSITLPYSSYTLTYGKTLDLSAAKVLPNDATDKTLVWTSSNPSVATVSDGIVTATSKAGTTTITAASQRNPSVTATCVITVKAQIVLATKVTITPSSLKMYLNETVEISATVTPTNADNKNVIWSTPQGAVTTVEPIGNNKAVVKAVSVGISRIIADSEDGNAEGWIQVTVSKNDVASVTLTPSALTLKVGETYDLESKVIAADTSAPASNPNVSWKSSNKDIAEVNSSGRVTAKSAGTATITVTSLGNSSKKATCEVTVLSSNTGAGGAQGIDFEDWNF